MGRFPIPLPGPCHRAMHQSSAMNIRTISAMSGRNPSFITNCPTFLSLPARVVGIPVTRERRCLARVIPKARLGEKVTDNPGTSFLRRRVMSLLSHERMCHARDGVSDRVDRCDPIG